MSKDTKRAKLERMAQGGTPPEQAVARDKLAGMPPGVMAEGQPPPMDMWDDATPMEPLRGRFAYVEETLGVASDPATQSPPMTLPPVDKVEYGPYRGQPIADVPTEALDAMRTMFANGAPPEVEAELRRRGS